jgi:hypothetical protein
MSGYNCEEKRRNYTNSPAPGRGVLADIIQGGAMEAGIKKQFSLYSSEKHKYRIRATFFDMISGDREPKQTKGLAAVFYWNHLFLFDFLNLDMVKKAVGRRLSAREITAITVSAEKYTVDNKKADIVITLDGKAGPLLAVIIEAKSIDAGGISTAALAGQIKAKYLEKGKFPELLEYEKVGVVLTKYTQLISDIAGVTWDQIIDLLEKRADSENELDITSQYLKFLTNIGGAMKYYDEEVLSLPAGKTSDLIQKHKVYSCKANSRNAKDKRPLFMAFREKGGAMSTLYKLEYSVRMDPKAPNAIEKLENSDADPGHIKRIKEYLESFPRLEESFPAEDYTFYVFSTDCNIDLPNKPRPAKNNTPLTYYTLKQMLEEEILPSKSTQ